MKILLLAKKNKPYVDRVIKIMKNNFKSVYFVDVERPNFTFEKLFRLRFDYIFSYINDKVIPQQILNNTKICNINFHPGPPSYPGYGCFNFALYDNVKTYGCTAHLMNQKVDTGKIIDVVDFKINKNETVLSLSEKTYYQMFFQFKNILFKIKNNQLTFSDQLWKRKPFKKKDLNKLCQIKPSMTKKEIKNRIRATSYPNKPGAFITLYGYSFQFKNDFND